MPKLPPNQSSQPPVSEMLYGLASADPGPHWVAFVERYSALIMRAVRQFEYEQDQRQECFLHVCEKLCDDGFKRLLKFNVSGRASFATWLGAVVHNLCVDWHRKHFGRAVMLPAIASLPAIDQSVYRLYYEQCEDRDYCLRLLQDDFPGLSREMLSESIARVHRALTPQQRWRMGVQRHRRRGTGFREAGLEYIASADKGPEQHVSEHEQRQRIRQALDGLSAHQRLLVLLRYEQGLTLKKIAELLGLADPFQARREIQTALDALARMLERAASP